MDSWLSNRDQVGLQFHTFDPLSKGIFTLHIISLFILVLFYYWFYYVWLFNYYSCFYFIIYYIYYYIFLNIYTNYRVLVSPSTFSCTSIFIVSSSELSWLPSPSLDSPSDYSDQGWKTFEMFTPFTTSVTSKCRLHILGDRVNLLSGINSCQMLNEFLGIWKKIIPLSLLTSLEFLTLQPLTWHRFPAIFLIAKSKKNGWRWQRMYGGLIYEIAR